jgi:hypothetical protein
VAPQDPEAPPEDLRSRLDQWQSLMQNSDPCELGRTLSRMPPCAETEDCAAYSLWQIRMPEGPMAALPDPQRRREMLPAVGPGTQRPPVVTYRLGEGEEPTPEELARKLAEVLLGAGYQPGEVVNVQLLGADADKRLQILLDDTSDEGALPPAEPEREPEDRRRTSWPGMVPCPAGH